MRRGGPGQRSSAARPPQRAGGSRAGRRLRGHGERPRRHPALPHTQAAARGGGRGSAGSSSGGGRSPRGDAGRLGAAGGAGRPGRLLHLPAAARHRVGLVEADAAGCHFPGGAADGKETPSEPVAGIAGRATVPGLPGRRARCRVPRPRRGRGRVGQSDDRSLLASSRPAGFVMEGFLCAASCFPTRGL